MKFTEIVEEHREHFEKIATGSLTTLKEMDTFFDYVESHGSFSGAKSVRKDWIERTADNAGLKASERTTFAFNAFAVFVEYVLAAGGRDKYIDKRLSVLNEIPTVAVAAPLPSTGLGVPAPNEDLTRPVLDGVAAKPQ